MTTIAPSWRDKLPQWKLRLEPWLPWLAIGIFFVAYTRLALLNYYRFDVGLDLGAYAQAMHQLSQGHMPFSSLRHLVMWGDHAHFILIGLAPFYWLWPDARLLLIVQVLAITTSAWPLYQLTQRFMQSRGAALALLLSYLSFVGIQYALDFDFHPSVLTAAAISWAVYALYEKSWWLYGASVFLGLLTREDAPPIFFLLGLWALLTRRWKVGLITMAVAAAYFLTAAYVLMPLWSPENVPLLYLDSEDKSIYGIVHSLVAHPIVMLQNMFDAKAKVRTIITLFAAFAFTPLLTPFTFITSASIFVSRFTSVHDYRWVLTNHSNANILPLLAYGALFGILRARRLAERFLSIRHQMAVPTLTVLLLTSCYFTAWRDPDGPLRAMLTPGRREPATVLQHRHEAFEKLAAAIPAQASLSASTGFTAALGNRQQLYAFPDQENEVEWLLLSTRVDTWPQRPEETKARILELRTDPRWQLVWSGYDVYGFRRVASESR